MAAKKDDIVNTFNDNVGQLMGSIGERIDKLHKRRENIDLEKYNQEFSDWKPHDPTGLEISELQKKIMIIISEEFVKFYQEKFGNKNAEKNIDDILKNKKFGNEITKLLNNKGVKIANNDEQQALKQIAVNIKRGAFDLIKNKKFQNTRITQTFMAMPAKRLNLDD